MVWGGGGGFPFPVLDLLDLNSTRQRECNLSMWLLKPFSSPKQFLKRVPCTK